MIKKVLLSFVLFAGLFLVLSSDAQASDYPTGGTIRHAYKPHVVNSTRAMRARVDNFSEQAGQKLVCVEAFKTNTGARTHLGCLKVELASFNSNGQWAFEFDAPTYKLNPGTYRVVYTYRADDGSWHQIMSTTLQVMNGSYVAY